MWMHVDVSMTYYPQSLSADKVAPTLCSVTNSFFLLCGVFLQELEFRPEGARQWWWHVRTSTPSG
jgi:hypothetical protein